MELDTRTLTVAIEQLEKIKAYHVAERNATRSNDRWVHEVRTIKATQACIDTLRLLRATKEGDDAEVGS